MVDDTCRRSNSFDLKLMRRFSAAGGIRGVSERLKENCQSENCLGEVETKLYLKESLTWTPKVNIR